MKILLLMSLLLKVEHISYTMGMNALPDIYMHLPEGQVCIYQVGPQTSAYIYVSGKALVPMV